MTRRAIGTLPLLFLLVAPLVVQAQSLSDKLDGMFVLGGCGDPLCLLLDPENDHGAHFLPSRVEANGVITAFLRNAVATSVGNLPFAAANGHQLFNFATGTSSEASPGPIFAERSQTLGEGNFFIGATVTGLSLSKVRGVSTDELEFAFTHDDDNPPSLGSRSVEDDLITVDTNLEMNFLATSVVAAYGLTRQLDVAVLIPVVRVSMTGSSQGQIDEAVAGSENHRFELAGGAPGTSATSEVEGTAVGFGDIGLRLKINLHQTSTFGAALLGDVRLPTGSSDDFLGAGESSIRGFGVLSGQLGNFAPHLNAGFAARSGSLNNSVLGALGFDHRMGERITVAFDLLADLQIGDAAVQVPAAAEFVSGSFRSTVLRTNIPDQKDNIVDAALGFKLDGGNNIRIVTNLIVPLADGGMRPSVLWTFGLEKVFVGGGGG